MEDIRKKLDPKQVTLSPLPVTEGALNKLKDVILNQVAIPTTQNRESIQLLWEQCQSEHRVVAYNAVRILLELVDSKVLELGPTLSGLSALSYQIKHPEGLVWAISQLLAIHSPKKYALVSNPHPYVVLLRSYPATWPHIHNVIQNQMNRAQTNGNNVIEDLRPLLMFLFCNPHHHEHFSGFRQILLVDLIQAQPNLQLKPFWEDVLQWLPFNSKVSAYEQYRMSLQIWSELGWDQPTLLPSLCSVIVSFSRFGLNPNIVIKDITNKWEASKCSDNIANESVIILSSALSETSSYQQRGIIELILSLCEKAQMIPEVIGIVLFQILVFVSKKTQITQRLVEQIETLKAMSKSKPVSDLSIVSVPIAPFHVPWAKARQVFNLLRFISGSERSTTQWLKSIERLNLGDFTDEVPVLSSIAILTDSGEQLILIMRIFGQVIGLQPEYALQVLAVLMHKLAQKTEPETKLALLTHIPMLGKDKLSIGVTVQLINSLGSRPGLICLKIKLLYDLWLIEDRIYPQLRKALDENTVMKTAHEYEFFLTKALVLKGVCEKSPSKHGADLLPMLSDILNKFGDPIDSALCCMALDGIRSLCEAQIIDIRTTVNVLWSKLWNDGRLRVRSHFYQILRVTALFDLESAVFQEFKSETLTRLWERLVLPGQGEDIPAISQAIVGFKLQDHKLKMLPSYVIENLKYPDGFIPKDDTSLPPKPEHVWEVIPSDIWTKLMTDCPIPELQHQFRDLLVHLLDEELKGLPRGAYYLSQAMKNRGEEPENYGFLKEGSILRGLIAYCQGVLNSRIPMHQEALQKVLWILSRPYPKHFPPLNWTWLENLQRYSKEALAIACLQCEHSRSAKWIVEKAIQNNASDEVLLTHAAKMAFGLEDDKLSEILEMGLNQRIRKIQCQSDVDNAARLMLTLKTSNKKSPMILECIEKLSKLIPQEEEELYEAYLDVIQELPTSTLDMMSNTSFHFQVSPTQIYRALSIRVHLACSDESDHPLNWLNTCIESASKMETLDMTSILRNLATVINHGRVKYPQANRQWLMELMGQVRATLRPGNNAKVFKRLFEIFTFAIVHFAQVDCFCHPKERLYSSPEECSDLLPIAVASLLQAKSVIWNGLGPQVCEWMLSLLSERAFPSELRNTVIAALPAFKVDEQYSEASMWSRIVLITSAMPLE
ncbi:hypothetical protein TCAL_03199 [Tigriopus californicus]|uniref:DUF3730 domain-containing protein n=1 Tax=Tigriopus californicus TaxID=6832 RepID=A0A553N6E1_TIGCA|nr:focadhesin-like [Tigriopus californicus]TRY61002.1 hypothetical protein TCAL_03199 [Tigriopus californicus]|eukprot:TCALIF_03199-PA protein Name:"Similar to Focad Focadhesin (Mus musculus)" AED:0.00 eAED:0.00 QI:210/1/1/1/1/1/4/54/1172